MFIHGHMSLIKHSIVCAELITEIVLMSRLVILIERLILFGLNRRYSVLF